MDKLFSFSRDNKVYSFEESFEELKEEFHKKFEVVRMLEVNYKNGGTSYRQSLTVSLNNPNGMRIRIRSGNPVGSTWTNVYEITSKCTIKVVELPTEILMTTNYLIWANKFIEFCIENKEPIRHVFLTYHSPFSGNW